MMQKNKALISLVIALSVASCGQSVYDSKSEMEAAMNEDDGLHYQKNVNGVEYSLTYKPTDLMVSQEILGSPKSDQVDRLRKKYGQYMYFSLSMSKDDSELLNSVASENQKFAHLLNDLAFRMDSKLFLVTQKKDTVPMTDFVYPRMYGMTHSTSILLVYPKSKKILEGDFLNLSISDLGLETGDVTFKISTAAIKNEPQLSFD